AATDGTGGTGGGSGGDGGPDGQGGSDGGGPDAGLPDDLWVTGYAYGTPNHNVILHWTSRAGWEMQADPIPSIGLQGIWGTSSSNIWIVGGGGNILHYDGSSWTSVQSGTTADLNAVWGSATTDVWGVGYSGTQGRVVHYDGVSWTDQGA